MATLARSALASALIHLAGNPDEDLAADDEAMIAACIDKEVASAWFEAYGPSRDPLPLAQGNVLADLILTALANGGDAEAAIAHSGILGAADSWYAAHEIAREIAGRHDEDLGDELTRNEYTDLVTLLASRIKPLLIDADTSRPRDALSSCDRAELLFLLSPPGSHEIDTSIASHKPWSEFAELYVDAGLAHALACLGYTVGQYRQASGNRYASERARGALRLHRPGVSRPAAALCSWDAIREIVDNACATNFLLAFYAMVPIVQLLDIDSARPVTFSKAALASYNPWSGTFHDAVSLENLTVTPDMGRFVSPAGWVSPDAICGFVHRYYEADISQPPSDVSPGRAIRPRRPGEGGKEVRKECAAAE
jgi:hypothetical protein